jgi:multidrug efflux system membrane fusion protein
MSNFRFHKIAAVVVAVATVAWVATGEFSSVGSAADKQEKPAEAAQAQRPLRTVAVVTPPRVKHSRAIRVSGNTEADKRTVVGARAAGVVAELPVEQGARVEKGDLIMKLDAEGKEAAVDSARSALAQRQAEADAAERLAKTGSTPKLQLESARAALALARSQLETAQAELTRNQVFAPFSGLVDKVSVELGGSVQVGTEIATVLKLDPLLAIGQVSERELGHLKVGDEADVRLVNGQEGKGKVRFISSDASQTTRTYRVEVAIENADRAIPAGMTAEITMRAAPVDAVVLPRSVVTLSGDGDLGIRAVDGAGKIAFYPIDLVDDTPQGLVLAGIPAEARVIVAGQELITEGDTVNAVEADPATIRKLAGEAAADTQ